jgi:heme-degrading monooxygenase HmoA
MIMRFTTGRFDPAQFEDIQRYARERQATTMKAVPGFQSFTAGFDRASGQYIGVSVWATEEAAQAGTEATTRIRHEFPPALPPAEGPLPRYYEVIAQA